MWHLFRHQTNDRVQIWPICSLSLSAVATVLGYKVPKDCGEIVVSLSEHPVHTFLNKISKLHNCKMFSVLHKAIPLTRTTFNHILFWLLYHSSENYE